LPMLENWIEGLSHCRGEFFLRLDDDNFFFQNGLSYLFKSLKKLRSENKDLWSVQYNSIILDHNKKILTAFEYSGVSTLENKISKTIEAKNCLKSAINGELLPGFDSNYFVLKKDYVESFFSPIYGSPLPDRRLTLRMLWETKGKGYFFNNMIVGCSRYDYRSRCKNLWINPISYFNYFLLKQKDTGKLVNNFYFSKAATISFIQNEGVMFKEIKKFTKLDLIKLSFQGAHASNKYCNNNVRMRTSLLLMPFDILIEIALLFTKFKLEHLTNVFKILTKFIFLPFRTIIWLIKPPIEPKVSPIYGDKIAIKGKIENKILLESSRIIKIEN